MCLMCMISLSNYTIFRNMGVEEISTINKKALRRDRATTISFKYDSD